MAKKELSKKTLKKSFWNWFYGNLTCFSQEHMQTFGYLVSMLPVVEELYDNKDDQKKAMETKLFLSKNLSDSKKTRSPNWKKLRGKRIHRLMNTTG